MPLRQDTMNVATLHHAHVSARDAPRKNTRASASLPAQTSLVASKAACAIKIQKLYARAAVTGLGAADGIHVVRPLEHLHRLARKLAHFGRRRHAAPSMSIVPSISKEIKFTDGIKSLHSVVVSHMHALRRITNPVEN